MSAILRTIGAMSLLLALETAAIGAAFDGALLDPAARPQSPASVELYSPALADNVEPTSAGDGKLVVLAHRDAADDSSDVTAENPYGFTFDEQADGAAEFCDFSALDCSPVWTGRVGAVILDRSQPEDNVLARPLGGLLSVSEGGDFDFGWDGGVDVYLARQFASGYGVEMRYFDLDSHAGFDYGDTGDLRIGHTTVTNLFDVDAAYNSQLHSTELNLRIPNSSRLTWLAGARWIELGERLNYDIDLLSLVNNDFKWNTDNHMYGGQFGADLRLWDLRSPLSINSVLKAGVYGNDAENHFRFKVNDFSILNGGADQGDVAFVGDIGVNVSYQLTRHVSLMGGYQLMWINGAALASDQSALTMRRLDIDVITTQGDLFYHGALTGAMLTW
jgi:hypothetical protein